MKEHLDEEKLIESHFISLKRVILFGVIADVTLEIGIQRDLEITIIPPNEEAAQIKIVVSQNWFGLSAGEFVSIDLDDLEDGMDGSYAFAASLVKSIMQNGIYESGMISEPDGKCIEWKCVIPTDYGELEFNRREISVFKRKPRSHTTREHRYHPFGSVL